MSQSLTNILVHIVFSTKSRIRYIHPKIEEELYNYIAKISNDLGSKIHIINGVEDHIHILVSLAKNISISEYVGKIKANSSRWIKSKGPAYLDFAWQAGYGGFSIAPSIMDQTVKYIANQKEHHNKITPEQELLLLLQKYDIKYDEKYLWV